MEQRDPPAEVGSNEGLGGTGWKLFYLIHFSDGGDPEGQLLHEGTEDECVKLANMLPAVSYSGQRPVAKCTLHWIEVTEADRQAAIAERARL
jgi:hypothetical protein